MDENRSVDRETEMYDANGICGKVASGVIFLIAFCPGLVEEIIDTDERRRASNSTQKSSKKHT